MPTRKQRRRRAKDRRHEYEYVYVDEEGREVEVAPEENGAAPKAARANGSVQKDARRRTGAREIPPPSWRRVVKRGLIFAPLMFLTVHFLAGKELDTQQELFQTVFLLLIFLPFSYVLDSMTYRMYRRRVERDAGRGPAPKKG